jgi:hypothetical protein
VAGGSAILAIKIIADAKDAVGEFDKAGSSIDKLGGTMSSMAVPALAVVGAFGAMAVAAAEDEAEQTKLSNAIAAAGAATAESNAQVEEAIKAGQARAFSDSEVRAGLQDLVTATGDVGEATDLLAVAQDVARLSGASLEQASAAVAKAHEGQGTALAKLLPGMDKGANAAETLANATALAAGQADSYAASAPGQMAIVGDSFGELGEEVGSAFLPILKDLIGIVSGVTKVLQENSDLVKTAAVVIGVLAAGILAANIAIKAFQAVQAAIRIATVAWTTAQAALNVVLNLNPIGIVVIAIVALVAAFVLAYKNSETFRNIVDGVFKAVVGFVQTAVATIKGVFSTVLAILETPFKTFQTVANTVFNAVKGIVTAAIGVIRGIFATVDEMLAAPFKAFEGVVRNVMNAVKGIVQSAVNFIEGILSGIRNAIQQVQDAVNAVNPFALPGGGGGVPAPRVARTGATGFSGGGFSGGSITINITGDPATIERSVLTALRSYGRRTGNLDLANI